MKTHMYGITHVVWMCKVALRILAHLHSGCISKIGDFAKHNYFVLLLLPGRSAITCKWLQKLPTSRHLYWENCSRYADRPHKLLVIKAVPCMVNGNGSGHNLRCGR